MAAVELQQATRETFHFINKPEDAINEALSGLTHIHPNLSYNPPYKILYRSDLGTFRNNHVTTIGFSGGGHEPMFGGFVGSNYLSAYVSGNIFASPTAAQIYEAIRMCQPTDACESKGTLVVCGNYTGDILNAGLAITRAQASGYNVRFVPVGDDSEYGFRPSPSKAPPSTALAAYQSTPFVPTFQAAAPNHFADTRINPHINFIVARANHPIDLEELLHQRDDTELRER
ncbi:unnamed protein product [Aureobasidium pullulans]|nr:unnamed protein product [Aureobasidium pullulans]